jgi:hypothetical protein
MTDEQARTRELASWLVEKAKGVEVDRQRRRREGEEAQREQEEAERLQAERARLHRQRIELEAWRRAEEDWAKEQQIENAKRNLEQRVTKATADLQSKRILYLFNRNKAQSELDSQYGYFAKEFMDLLAKVDSETHERLSSRASTILELMMKKAQGSIEEKLKKEARECCLPYVSPF